jgi:hypothetical protein
MPKLHAIAGGTGFLTILTFWTASLLSELFGGAETVAAVKTAILWGLLLLIPAMATLGATGQWLKTRRRGPLVSQKARRMPIIALNGLLILVPAAIFLAMKARVGAFDTWFYTVQAVEFLAGATNLWLMGLSLRDGMRLTGRLRRTATN